MSVFFALFFSFFFPGGLGEFEFFLWKKLSVWVFKFGEEEEEERRRKGYMIWVKERR